MSEVTASAFTCVERVRELLVGTTLTDPEIEGCIATATIICVENLQSSGLSSMAISEIAAYLSAHFGALRDLTMRVKAEELGDAKVQYMRKNESKFSDLNSTEWGATALMLDSSGTLRTLGKKQPRIISLDLCNV